MNPCDLNSRPQWRANEHLTRKAWKNLSVLISFGDRSVEVRCSGDLSGCSALYPRAIFRKIASAYISHRLSEHFRYAWNADRTSYLLIARRSRGGHQSSGVSIHAGVSFFYMTRRQMDAIVGWYTGRRAKK